MMALQQPQVWDMLVGKFRRTYVGQALLPRLKNPCGHHPSNSFEINIATGKVLVLQQKIDALQAELCWVADKVTIPAKTLAHLTGNIISMSMAIGPVARLMARALYALLNTKVSWSQVVPLSDEARVEILF